MTEARGELKQGMLECVEKARKQSREHCSREKSPNITVGDNILVARVRQLERDLEVVEMWTGP